MWSRFAPDDRRSRLPVCWVVWKLTLPSEEYLLTCCNTSGARRAHRKQKCALAKRFARVRSFLLVWTDSKMHGFLTFVCLLDLFYLLFFFFLTFVSFLIFIFCAELKMWVFRSLWEYWMTLSFSVIYFFVFCVVIQYRPHMLFPILLHSVTKKV